MPKRTQDREDAELSPVTERDERDWEIVPADEAIHAAPRLGAMVSVRLDPELARLVRRAARGEGVTQSEFLRRAAEERARRLAAAEPVTIATRAGTTPPLVWHPSKATAPHQDESVTDSSAQTVVEFTNR